MPVILIIDDENNYFELCQRLMPEYSFLEPAHNYREAEAALKRFSHKLDLVLLDVHFNISEKELLPYNKTKLFEQNKRSAVLEELKRSQGFKILTKIRNKYPDLPLIVMTSRDDLPLEIDAERLQAEGYTYLLEDEYLDARSLKLQIEAILTQSSRQQVSVQEPFYWGTTTKMLNLRRRLSILARGRLPMMIHGATGTGKSLLAREFIHPHSGRSGRFVAVDLSTIPKELMAAHLFGVVKGAYTGATSTREGVFAQAHEGTLFLDEIANLSLELQKALLLVLQEGVYHPVGSAAEQDVDVKLVVAANENLGELVAKGCFREDLYMRMNPSTAVELPTIKERKEDFLGLLQVFIRRVVRESYNRDLLLQYAKQRGIVSSCQPENFFVSVGSGLPSQRNSDRIYFLFHSSSFTLLSNYDWPGNFRQFEMTLSNLITLTLVELVEYAEKIEPGVGPGAKKETRRVDVIPILPKTVSDLLQPMKKREKRESVQRGGKKVSESSSDIEFCVQLTSAHSLNEVSCFVERQYLEQLYKHFSGNLNKMGRYLLNSEQAGRKIQLRMNQLGIKLRAIKHE